MSFNDSPRSSTSSRATAVSVWRSQRPDPACVLSPLPQVGGCSAAGHVFLVSTQSAVLPAVMRQLRAAPPSLLAAALALAFALAVSPRHTCGATPFPQDLEPISVVGRESKSLTLALP